MVGILVSKEDEKVNLPLVTVQNEEQQDITNISVTEGCYMLVSYNYSILYCDTCS